MEVVDRAVVKMSPVSPNVMKNTVIGLMIGFLLSAGVIVLRELTDTTIRSEEMLLEKMPDIPILAVVPDLTASSSGGYYAYGK